MTFILRGTYNERPVTVWRIGDDDIEGDEALILDAQVAASMGDELDLAPECPSVRASTDGPGLDVLLTAVAHLDRQAPFSLLADPELRDQYEQMLGPPDVYDTPPEARPPWREEDWRVWGIALAVS